MKKKIAIVCGGNSGEYEISIKSAAIVKKNLNPDLFEGYIILIKGKDWFFINNDNSQIPIDKNDFSIRRENKKIVFDCVFNAIHGTPGEDGKLQGYFSMLEIPHTSSDVLNSALTFNKYYTNIVASHFGIQIARSYIIKSNQKYDLNDVLKNISLPCIVKPTESGSSVGTNKVNQPPELEQAISEALHAGNEVLIEEFISGIEITCGILQNRNQLVALPITEIVPKHEFFNYIAKYSAGQADEITPARISDSEAELCKKTSLMLFEKLNCKGLARFDYILSDKKLYFLEVNTVPGLSEASIVPKQANVAGISIEELFTIMINTAIEAK